MYYALVDCNSFYCSCERLFRPDLKNKPVGVLSNNDGCFISRSHELKALGVTMAVPYFKVKHLCKQHRVHVFSANFPFYTHMSERVMSVLASLTPRVEVYSIDEAFVELQHSDIDTLEQQAQDIKATVERHTGIPVSIGVGSTKALSKVANEYAKKKSGICVLATSSQACKVLGETPIAQLWGVGRKNAQKMHALGLHTALQFRDYRDQKHIQSMFSIVGKHIQDELRGHVRFDLHQNPEKKKHIMSSRTFGKAVRSLEDLKEAVASYACLAGEKLRRQGSRCKRVGISIRTNQHRQTQQHRGYGEHLALNPTADSRKIVRFAWSALEETFQPGHAYKKAAVFLGELGELQESLFEEQDTPQDDKLMQTMDFINYKEGKGTIKLAACGLQKKSWHAQQAHLSPRYTSDWTQIPVVY